MKDKSTIFYKPLIIIGFLSLYLFSCSNELPPAGGNQNDIVILADSVEYEFFKETVNDVFGKVIMTPQPESIFDLRRVHISKLSSVKTMKNIIIIAPLDSKTKTSEFINSMMGDELKEQVENDSIFVFNKKDLWAKEQLVMIITGPDRETLKSNLIKNADNLLYQFKKISDDRLSKSLYSDKYEKKDVQARFYFDYEWMMYVQADFEVALEDKENKFVWLRREINSDKERWIFVHWIENASPLFLNKDSVYSKRNELTRKFLKFTDNKNYVELIDDYLKTTEVNFNGRYALFTQGLWRNTNKGSGGPFINYTFYDEKTERIYMIDAALFAPKYFKRGMLQQLDVILHSFMTKDEVQPDKVKQMTDFVNKNQK